MLDLTTHPPSPFTEEFRTFAMQEERKMPPKNPVLFYGSSSIRLWETLESDFAGVDVLNRGFGGSTLADCVAEMEWLVFPMNPRVIVLYAGDNDLDGGASPERVLALFQRFTRGVRERLGGTPIVFVSVKPSPCRFWNVANIRRANALVREEIGTAPSLRYVDVFHPMLGPSAGPRPELFTADGLHMNRDGYRLWAGLIRGTLSELGAL